MSAGYRSFSMFYATARSTTRSISIRWLEPNPSHALPIRATIEKSTRTPDGPYAILKSFPVSKRNDRF